VCVFWVVLNDRTTVIRRSLFVEEEPMNSMPYQEEYAMANQGGGKPDIVSDIGFSVGSAYFLGRCFVYRLRPRYRFGKRAERVPVKSSNSNLNGGKTTTLTGGGSNVGSMRRYKRTPSGGRYFFTAGVVSTTGAAGKRPYCSNFLSRNRTVQTICQIGEVSRCDQVFEYPMRPGKKKNGSGAFASGTTSADVVLSVSGTVCQGTPKNQGLPANAGHDLLFSSEPTFDDRRVATPGQLPSHRVLWRNTIPPSMSLIREEAS
jgi:hypothetical protein